MTDPFAGQNHTATTLAAENASAQAVLMAERALVRLGHASHLAVQTAIAAESAARSSLADDGTPTATVHLTAQGALSAASDVHAALVELGQRLSHLGYRMSEVTAHHFEVSVLLDAVEGEG